MSHKRIRTSPVNAPLTTKELTGYELSTYDKGFKRGRLMVCSKCGLSGGTLVKDGKDGYCHQDGDTCKILQLRSRVDKAKIKKTA